MADLEKEVVKELIQHELTAENLALELKKLTQDHDYRDQIISEYKLINEKLGGPGASARAAKVISDFLATTKTPPISS